MAISNLNDLINSFGRSQLRTPTKYGSTNSANAGYWNSGWRMAGSNFPASLPTTGNGAVCDGSTSGRIIITDPSGGRKLYLSRFNYSPSNATSPYLMDRLVHNSGLVGNVTTLQSFNTVTLPSRATGGEGVEIWLEWYSSTGATVSTFTVTYTNQAGTSGRTTSVAVPATFRATGSIRVPLAAGDTGVQSVQGVQLSASTGTAGNFGVTLCKRIATLPVGAINTVTGQGPIQLGLPEVPSNSCLFLMTTASSATSPSYDTELLFVEN